MGQSGRGLFLDRPCCPRPTAQAQSAGSEPATEAEHGDEGSHVWAGALLACYAGLAVGVLFLSFNHHDLLWTYLGCPAHCRHPGRRVQVGVEDVFMVAVVDLALLACLFVYVRLKGIG